MKKTMADRYVIADPKVCHGNPTFRGTRILVSDVLELVASGMDWDDIIKECRGDISRAAIAEAIRFAGRALAAHGNGRRERPIPA
jgi:uncharacterized protein (DUF433 family)